MLVIFVKNQMRNFQGILWNVNEIPNIKGTPLALQTFVKKILLAARCDECSFCKVILLSETEINIVLYNLEH